MINTDLKGKKLLLVGGLNNTVDLINLAHRNGVTVGVADYNHGTLAKSLADYAYDVDGSHGNEVQTVLLESGGKLPVGQLFYHAYDPVCSCYECCKKE